MESTQHSSRIPIRSESSITLSLSDLNLNKSLYSDDNKRKRSSMIHYKSTFSTTSRIPIPVSSSNLNKPLTTSKSLRRLSAITNNTENGSISNSKSKENLLPSKVSELSVNDSKIPRSPSTLSIYSKRERRRSMLPLTNCSVENVSFSNAQSSSNKTKPMPLKFNYRTTELPKQTFEKPTSNRLSRMNRLCTQQNIQMKNKPNRVQTMNELIEILVKDPSSRYKILNKTNRVKQEDKISFIPYEDLSTKRPEMFNNLTMYEKIMQYPEIYFTGNNKSNKIKADLKNAKHNYNFDDDNGNLKIITGDHIKYRYEIKEILGNGAFGTVISVIDHSYKEKPMFGCKIIKNDVKWSFQSIEEIKIMKKVREHENIVKYIKHFNFRSHMIIIMELLGLSLYEAIKINNFEGFGINIVKHIMKETLNGIQFIHSKGIIHCDLKPENLMIQYNGKIKIIDFGSSCYKGRLRFSYLQSRFYRAPEVLLGGRYDEKIDLWSIGIIGIELYTGIPIFQPDDEWALFCDFVEYLNIPPRKMILQLRQDVIQHGIVGGDNTSSDINKTLLFRVFDTHGGLNLRLLGKTRAGGKSVRHFLEMRSETQTEQGPFSDFVSVVSLLLVWNAKNRADAEQVLACAFFQE